MSKKYIFGNKITKIALGLHTWVMSCVCRPKHAYAVTFLRTQLGFQKNKKCKFFEIMAEVWNESHILEVVPNPIFSTIKNFT